MNPRRFWLGLVLCASLSACGGDDDAASAGSATAASVASCNAQCDAQEKVRGTGCEPFVDLATCKQLCTTLAKNAKGCAKQFDAYYDCSAADGFVCAGSL